MIADQEFVARFREVCMVHGAFRPYSPAEVADSWDQFVGLCQRGYEDNLDEYDNDLSVRDLIESVLTDDRMKDVDQLQWVRERVDLADARFRELLASGPTVRPGDERWWRVRVPGYGGTELARDLASRYQVTVQVK